jgi:hypothetical protein
MGPRGAWIFTYVIIYSEACLNQTSLGPTFVFRIDNQTVTKLHFFCMKNKKNKNCQNILWQNITNDLNSTTCINQFNYYLF